jgi:hypothetical protein
MNSFVKFVATKKGLTKNFFPSLSLLIVFGSGIRDPGWVKIMIPDPQHCLLAKLDALYLPLPPETIHFLRVICAIYGTLADELNLTVLAFFLSLHAVLWIRVHRIH